MPTCGECKNFKRGILQSECLLGNQNRGVIDKLLDRKTRVNADTPSCINFKKKGCFIATAAYGTPFAEEINALRYWRDEFLEKTNIGRRFISAYYEISPPIAEVISKSSKLRAVTRLILRPIIALVRWFINE